MFNFSSRIQDIQVTAKMLRDLYDSMTDPSIISFGGGAPASDALPVETIREIIADVLYRDKRGIEAIQYGNPAGTVQLRKLLLEHLLAPQGVELTEKNVLLVNGGIQTANVMCQLFIEPGDKIIVESPTFVQAIQIFELFGAKCIPCGMDENGIMTDQLEELIKKEHPKMIYVIPTFQNPTGITLSLERRKKVAELADQYEVMVLEDDPYRDVRYTGEPLPPIKKFDKTGHTVMACSLSKILSPGIRLGFMVADERLIKEGYNIMTSTNSHAGTFSQVIASEFFKNGHYEPHIENIKKLYAERRDVMIECLKEYFPKEIKYTYPDGGLFTWVTLPEKLDATNLIEEAFEKKVSYCVGEGFYAEKGGKGRNEMRLSFCAVEVDKIRLGMKRLGELIQSKL